MPCSAFDSRLAHQKEGYPIWDILLFYVSGMAEKPPDKGAPQKRLLLWGEEPQGSGRSFAARQKRRQADFAATRLPPRAPKTRISRLGYPCFWCGAFPVTHMSPRKTDHDLFRRFTAKLCEVFCQAENSAPVDTTTGALFLREESFSRFRLPCIRSPPEIRDGPDSRPAGWWRREDFPPERDNAPDRTSARWRA